MPNQHIASFLAFAPGPMFPGYVIAGLVAALVGGTDILNRYKENPLNAIGTRAAWIYIAINGLFGVAAFWLAMVLDIVKFDAKDSVTALNTDVVKNGLLAGFGAILILRSIAFKISVGDKNGGEVGPSTLVDALLSTFDQAINRTVALQKDASVRMLMRDISFEKCSAFIPLYCLSLLQRDDQRAKNVGELIGSIAAFKKDDPDADGERAFLLGNMLINNFGLPVTKSVLDGFKTEMRKTSGGGTA